jgi:hypothetical protein
VSACIASFASCVLLPLLAAAPARADIFKCTANKAMPTYQNFPCEFDSLGAVQAGVESGAAAANTSVAAARGPAANGKPGRGAGVVPAATRPRVGMTTAEVKAIWGEPNDASREEFAKGDIETWTYADSRSIRFDAKGRVQQIKW